MLLVLMGVTWVGSDTLWAGFINTKVNYNRYPLSPAPKDVLEKSALPNPSDSARSVSPAVPSPAQRNMNVRPEDDTLNILPAFSRIVSVIYTEMQES